MSNIEVLMKWIEEKKLNTETSMNSKVILNEEGVNNLANFANTINISTLIYGDYTKWCSQLIWFPIDFIANKSPKELKLGGNSTSIDSFPNDEKNSFFIGQFHYLSKYNDFRDYEPYTTSQLYLPFFGYVDLKIADIINKYIQIRLQIDRGTGQACYTIGVSETQKQPTNLPFLDGVDDSDTRILSQNVFQLGVTIPLGTTNAIETARNIINSAVKGVSSIASAYVSAGAGLGISKSTGFTKQVITTRNKKTGRQITKGIKTTDMSKQYDNTNYLKSRGVSELFETSADVLTKIHISPTTDKPNNSIINSLNTFDVVLVKKYCNMKNVDEEYRKLYGVPLGEVKTLNTIHGYTEISKIHIEGADFGTATQTEIAMLEEMLSDGVILP